MNNETDREPERPQSGAELSQKENRHKNMENYKKKTSQKRKSNTLLSTLHTLPVVTSLTHGFWLFEMQTAAVY